MRRSSRPCLPALLIAWVAFWGVPACFAEPGGPAVRLVSPHDGATLVAGTMAELAWEPLEPFARRFPHVEEWEAFLSLDSGKTYPIEITQHLDQDIRRIRWQVPSLPTEHAAILLRFGDERREVSVDIPVRFSIAASSASTSIWESTLHLAHRVLTRGESAVPGEPGVVAWVEGSRRGGGARQVVAVDSPGAMRERLDPRSAHSEAAEAVTESRPSGSSLARIRSKAGGAALPVHRAALAQAGTAPSLPSDILLLIQRQNE